MQVLKLDQFSIDIESGNEFAPYMIIMRSIPETTAGVGVYRLVESGPQLMLGASPKFDSDGEHRIPSLGAWPPGLYVAVITLADTTSGHFPALEDALNGHHFFIGDEESRPNNLLVAVSEMLAAQLAFRDREVRAVGYEGQNRVILHVILDGCLLDYEQDFEGGRLSPLSQRLGADNIISVVNSMLPSGIRFENTENLNSNYGRDHPLALVTFNNVAAEDESGCIAAVQRRLTRVMGALSIDRGASPTPITYLFERPGPEFTMRVPLSIYRGNLIGGFGPGVTGLLDLIEKASVQDPWIDFALGLYRTVRLQNDPSGQLYQAWALVEAAAKRRVPKGSAPVLDGFGKRVSTTAKDLGRVIFYLRDHIGLGNRSTGVGQSMDLCDLVSEVYSARNRIAHEGGVDSPANNTPPPNVHELARVIRDWAEYVFRCECRITLESKSGLDLQSDTSASLPVGQ